MGRNHILNKFFSSGIQAIAVQILGIFFFYVISLYFSKDNFGLISWANALCLFVTTILSFGLEQIVVRRIAVSKSSDWAASAYLFHSFWTSILMLALLFVVSKIFPGPGITIFLLFFLVQSLVNLTVPLRQLLNAKEIFTPYGIIALVSNSGKIATAIVLARIGSLTIPNIVIVLCLFAFFEFTCLVVFIVMKPGLVISFRFKMNAYGKLLKESAHQYVAVIFDSSLSRMDWILLGFLSTSAITADYSFAYRAFEIVRLPIAILAPVILPVFSRLLHQQPHFDNERKAMISDLFGTEVFVALGIFLIANILWTPVMSAITHGKYGQSNNREFFILSLCIPLHFFINLLWTISFSARKYREISLTTIASAVANIAFNLLLIPTFGGAGAAISFLITCLLQASIYYFVVVRTIVSLPIARMLLFYIVAGAILWLSGYYIMNAVLRLIAAMGLYLAFSIILRQVGKRQMLSVKSLLTR